MPPTIDLAEGGEKHADSLIAELDAAPEWPLPRERRALEQAFMGRAFRRNDVAALKALAGWGLDRPTYVPDALGRRIAVGFADFLFAEDLDLGELADSAENLGELVEENDLTARLHRAERIVVSEGEAWWKLHRNPAISPFTMISWTSRANVVPLFYGDRVLAAAFVSEVGRDVRYGGDGEEDQYVVYRHAEIHAAGLIRHVLYQGDDDTLGERVELTARPATAAFLEEWRHGGPMLAGRITNDLDDDDTLGESEYTPVKDLLLGVNEAVTIGVENARLTGKDRIAVAGRFTRAGGFDASLDVFEVEQDGGVLGESGSLPIFAIEKKYDAEPLWLHIDNLVRMTLSRVGLVAQIVGQDENTGGGTESGVARRLRFLPTTNAAQAKQRPWIAALPKILALMERMPDTGGRMTGGDLDLPSVTIRDPLPRDESEEITDHATAVGAEIMSRETSIRLRNPSWSDAEVSKELERIAAERDAAMPEAFRPPAPNAEHDDDEDEAVGE